MNSGDSDQYMLGKAVDRTVLQQSREDDDLKVRLVDYP